MVVTVAGRYEPCHPQELPQGILGAVVLHAGTQVRLAVQLFEPGTAVLAPAAHIAFLVLDVGGQSLQMAAENLALPHDLEYRPVEDLHGLQVVRIVPANATPKEPRACGVVLTLRNATEVALALEAEGTGSRRVLLAATAVPVGGSGSLLGDALRRVAADARKSSSVASTPLRRLEGEDLVPRVARTTTVTVTTTDPYPEILGAPCRGKEVQWAACEGQPSCVACQPQKCEFASWSDWFPMGGCTGLCVRDRAIAVRNNECGKPCDGPKIDTKRDGTCLPSDCKVSSQDCQWNDWDEWLPCGSSKEGQSYRSREVRQRPSGFGQPCVGPLNQTRPCGKPEPSLDCRLADWEPWTRCSSPCGGGWKARLRSVARHSTAGGKPCEDVLRETVSCNVQHCRLERPCELSAWEDWQGCNTASQQQKYRMRQILHSSSTWGGQCNHALRETAGCTDVDPAPTTCTLSQWLDWSSCSSTCNGQHFRSRIMRTPTQSFCFVNTEYPLKEVAACGLTTCESSDSVCQVSEWSDWSECSQTCGPGVTLRSRTLIQALTGCSLALKMVKACMARECTLVDCKWGGWDAWSGCTCTCGGGLKRRSRVIAASPRNGGKLCEPEEKHQVAPCATQSCSHCVDGQWGAWGAWSGCSDTCAPANRVRHRSIEIHHNHCGEPASGLEDEYSLCEELRPCVANVDCMLSDWQAWSACSWKCFGMRERRRRVVRFASGSGSSCSGPLTDVGPCHPAPNEDVPADCGPPPAHPCEVAQWSSWTECSASCGGGQRKRGRTIIAPNNRGGDPCNTTLAEVARCEEHACVEVPCTDCQWGQWGDWGACSKCGDQRFRHRLIEKMPDRCGKKCELGAAKEVGRCTSHCESERYCTWSAWSDMNLCAGRCGKATKLRQRQMALWEARPNASIVLVGGGRCLDAHGATYSKYRGSVGSRAECLAVLRALESTRGVRGIEHQNGNISSCDVLVEDKLMQAPPGVIFVPGGGAVGPIHHSSGEEPWSCWGMVEPFLFKGSADSICSGVQTGVAKCRLVDCNGECSPQDCVFSSWSSWTSPSCTQLCERTRLIEHRGLCGGKVCDGPLVETKRCEKECLHPKDCVLGEWSMWNPGECNPPQQRSRSRAVLQEPRNGGLPCRAVLEETAACGGKAPQAADCHTSPWQTWTACSRTCDPGLRMRSRVVVNEAVGGGKPCSGELQELVACNAGSCPVVNRDAVVAAWSEWSGCTTEGVRFRHRNVTEEPLGTGRAAAGSVLEANSCSTKLDCIVSDWTRWEACDKSCDGGQQKRHRQVTQNPRGGGKECESVLCEIQGCNRSPCEKVDCQVSDWSLWSDCSSTCGLGQRSRNRFVQQAAKDDGEGCNLDLSIVEPCHADGPKCGPSTIDCLWSQWSDWDACSCDCDGGEHKRTRQVAVMPTQGGKPCKPVTTEEVSACNTQPCHQEECIDGHWAGWQSWAACSATCKGGITYRVRRADRQANYCGRPAVGPSQEHASCNVGVPCAESVDCQFSKWSLWSSCAAMTDLCVGRQQRSRLFAQHGRENGRWCIGAMKEEKACVPPEARNCEQREPVDCILRDWSDWGDCDAECGRGQKVRQRAVYRHGANGGALCNSTLQATKPCDSGKPCDTCKDVDCRWSNWAEWGTCTKCGGQKIRGRHIVQHAECQGLPCVPGSSEEVAKCPRQCHDPQYCVWDDWAPWDSCMQDCGPSIRKRTRLLRKVKVKPTSPSRLLEVGDAGRLSELQAKYEQLHQRAAVMEARRVKELLVCFAAGCLSFLSGLLAVRTFSRAHYVDLQERLCVSAPTVALRLVSRPLSARDQLYSRLDVVGEYSD